MTNSFQVLIIGGGIGGLCLAQGLRQAGIGVTVFERDAAALARGQGYRISLQPVGVHALRSCLPDNLFELAVATSIRPAQRLVFLDHQLNAKFSKPTGEPPDRPDREKFGVNRLTLREILLTGLGDAVRFGREFRHYETLPDGRVRACFADGGTATGDLLVGADGWNSAVRRQLLPEARLAEHNHLIYGRTVIGPDTLSWVDEVLVDTFNPMRDPAGVGVSVATCRTFEPVGQAAARLVPAARLTEIPGYFSWTVSVPDRPEGSPGALHARAEELLRGWHPSVRRIVGEAEVADTFGVTVRVAEPVGGWFEPSVTLLGDAIHCMTPSRGSGAGIALRDAELLCAELSGGELGVGKQRYEKEMLRYGFEAVRASVERPFLKR